MRTLKSISWIVCVLVMLASCRKDEDLNLQQPLGLGGDVSASTAIDKWLLDSLTNPYNIAVRYRWDPSNASLFLPVTPVEESRVIPLFSMLKRLWINPYNEETGSELFMKRYAPKQLVLIGSVEYLTNTLAHLGEAEGGASIVFFDINQNYDPNPVTSAKRIIQTVHHEFGHSLHLIVKYPQDFIGISSQLGLPGYTATWYNVSEAEAVSNGYATRYAMNNADDDFVETIAIMLSEGKIKWEEMKASTNAVARQALQQKEDLVVSYYRQVWNIDFYRLQSKIQVALNGLFPLPTVSAVFGLNKTYSAASVNPANTSFLPQSPSFTAVFNAAKTGLASIVNGGTSGRVLDSFAVAHYTAESVLLVCFYHTPAAPATVEEALYLFNYITDASDIYTFTLAARDANGTAFAAGLAPLVNYFGTNRFSLTWYADPTASIFPRVRFTPVANPDTYFTALLIP